MDSHLALQKWGEEMKGDDHLFVILDVTLPPETAIPVIVVGHHAYDYAKSGKHSIEYYGPNPTSKAVLLKQTIEEVRRNLGDLNIRPKTSAERIQELEAELEKAKAQLEVKNLPPADPPKKGKGNPDEKEIKP